MRQYAQACSLWSLQAACRIGRQRWRSVIWEMNDRVETVVKRALSAIENARTTAALEEARVRLLGRKGELTLLMRQNEVDRS